MFNLMTKFEANQRSDFLAISHDILTTTCFHGFFGLKNRKQIIYHFNK